MVRTVSAYKSLYCILNLQRNRQLKSNSQLLNGQPKPFIDDDPSLLKNQSQICEFIEELIDSNHNVNCEKSFSELFIGRISFEVTLISQVTTSACQFLNNTTRRSAIFMQDHCQTVTRWCSVGPSAIIAFLSAIPYQGISCVAAVTFG